MLLCVNTLILRVNVVLRRIASTTILIDIHFVVVIVRVEALTAIGLTWIMTLSLLAIVPLLTLLVRGMLYALNLIHVHPLLRLKLTHLELQVLILLLQNIDFDRVVFLEIGDLLV